MKNVMEICGDGKFTSAKKKIRRDLNKMLSIDEHSLS